MQRTSPSLLVALVVALVVGCSPGPPPGLERWEVDRIRSSTDCEQLQRDFEQAIDNAKHRLPDEERTASLHYAIVIDERMQEIGCYQ